MYVKINVSDDIDETYVVIHTNEITAEVNRIVSLIERSDSNNIVTASENGRIFVIKPSDIYMVRTENEKTVIYTKTDKYICKKRLYELEELLNGDFMRISKSVIVNLGYLDCVEPSLGGVMLVVLKNGCKDYISRRYLPNFKKYLGI